MTALSAMYNGCTKEAHHRDCVSRKEYEKIKAKWRPKWKMEEQGLFSPRVTKGLLKKQYLKEELLQWNVVFSPALSDLNVHLPVSHVTGILWLPNLACSPPDCDFTRGQCASEILKAARATEDVEYGSKQASGRYGRLWEWREREKWNEICYRHLTGNWLGTKSCWKYTHQVHRNL